MANIYALRYRAPIRFVGIGVAPEPFLPDEAIPSITSGVGVPTANAADGSVYLNMSAGSAADCLYARIAAAWVALDCT